MTPAAPRSLPWLLIGAFFALYFIWGSTYLVIRIGVETWPPMLLAGVRFLIAGMLLAAWARWRGLRWPTRRQWAGAGVLGVLLLACGNGGVTVAEHWGVGSGVAALVVATVPLFALLFARLFGDRNSALEWGGVLLGVVGIVLLNSGANLQASPAGAGLIVFAAAAWAFGSVWSRRLDLPAGAMASAAQMLVGGTVLLCGSWLGGESMQQWPDLRGWLALGYLVVFGSIIAFSAYVYLLATVRPAAATSYAFVNPAVAVALGVMFADEQVGIAEALAMAVIIAAVVLIGLPQWRRREP
ncbi:drug/metabolite exporter YedA [Isoalcanivorax beigongshangi]|uniref:Drug/metabolite exporter YedA n=1 Tax=Isoalcanivorax beigongshangi TaxID=3238810 RepID=A0ABV4AKV0_9GAMM